MCLVIKPKQKALVVKKDIKCFKIVSKTKKERLLCSFHPQGTLITPYREEVVVPGLTVTSKIEVNRRQCNTNIADIDVAIHSFTNKIVADKDCEWINDHWGDKFIAKVFECIIPKGAKYYIGQFDGYIAGGYASDTLIYPETIEVP